MRISGALDINSLLLQDRNCVRCLNKQNYYALAHPRSLKEMEVILVIHRKKQHEEKYNDSFKVGLKVKNK